MSSASHLSLSVTVSRFLGFVNENSGLPAASGSLAPPSPSEILKKCCSTSGMERVLTRVCWLRIMIHSVWLTIHGRSDSSYQVPGDERVMRGMRGKGKVYFQP